MIQNNQAQTPKVHYCDDCKKQLLQCACHDETFAAKEPASWEDEEGAWYDRQRIN